MQRSGHALILDTGLWLIDPIDLPDLDGQLAELGRVAGVILTLGRHTRGSFAIAERHGVEVFADEALGTNKSDVRSIRERFPDTPLMSVPLRGRGMRFWWREGAVWWPERRLAVVGESLGNPPYYLLRDEILGLHPVRRGQPPRELGRLDIDQLLCGHGNGVATNAGTVVREVLENGPRRRSLFWMFTTFQSYR